MERLQTDEVALEPPPPDLLQELGSEQATVFGITGTLQSLAGKCPINLSDPRITLEMKNDFVIKAANESGLAIGSEYEALFTSRLEHFGLERKFTVKPPEPEPAPGKTHSERPKTSGRDDAAAVAAKPQTAPVAPVAKTGAMQKLPVEVSSSAQPALSVTSPHERPVEPEGRSAAAVVEALSDIALQARKVAVDVSREPVKPAVAPPATRPEAAELPAPEPTPGYHDWQGMAAMARAEALWRSSGPLSEQIEEAEDFTPVQDGPQDGPQDWSIPFPDLGPAYYPAAQYAPPEETTAGNPAETADPEVLVAELYKPPQEVYQDFSAALDEVAQVLLAGELFTPPPESAPPMSPEPLAADTATLPADHPRTAVLALLGEVTAGLRELSTDDQLAAGEAIREVMGALHGLRVLELSSDRTGLPGARADARAGLEQACARLFELLGREPLEPDIGLFVQTLLLPLFAAQFRASEPLDERLDGMHERLRGLATASYWWPVLSHQLLGRIVLAQPVVA